MQIDLETLLRRLMLMGVPLLAEVGCGASSCPSTTPVGTDRFVEIANPNLAAGGGGASAMGISQAAYQRCADALDCDALCQEYFSPMGQFLLSCERVATDAFEPATERLALHAKTYYPCEGRRPEDCGPLPVPVRAREEVGAFLARAAYLEGVSVPAFQRLRAELAAHGAPASLVRAAGRAARDEVRHHRVMTTLARRCGAEPAAIPAAFPAHVRTLEAIATENATEGCVREALGAIVAREQAGHAALRPVRAALRAVARDEGRHAELAFAVDTWAHAKLRPAMRRRVSDARDAAVGRLADEVNGPIVPEVVHLLGVPREQIQRALVIGLGAILARA
ncbi:MAG: hypothetical protein ABJA82_04450 [Myxococcales bacterium]